MSVDDTSTRWLKSNMMIMYDGKGQPYVDFESARITVSERTGEKDWEGVRRYLTIRAYRGDGSQSLHSGADIPITSDRNAQDILIAAHAAMTLLTR
jgi:hypothetical protein